MTSGPVIVQVLEGDNAVEKYRKIMGATNPENADNGTIRRNGSTKWAIKRVNNPSERERRSNIDPAWTNLQPRKPLPRIQMQKQVVWDIKSGIEQGIELTLPSIKWSKPTYGPNGAIFTNFACIKILTRY